MRKLILALWTCLPAPLFCQTGISVPQMAACNGIIQNFLTTYNIPGAAVAIAKDGRIVYNRGFGFSDIAKTIPVQPHNLFRLASVSKPVTGMAIMKLIENGQLTLDAKVFGPGGILENFPGIATANITDARIYNITIKHLLEHTAGWNRDVNCNPNPTVPYPYFFAGCDPIGFPLRVTMLTGTSNPVSKEALIKFLLERGLNFAPGTAYNYSNIGYLILGRVIEKITGLSYENYLKEHLFKPLGIFDIRNGKNLLADKQEREVEYTGNGYTNLSVYNTGQQVPWEYGGFSVEAMDAHGGLIATASDMLKLLTAVDGFNTKPDILQPATITQMVTPSSVNQYYAKGFSVNPNNNWWHTGGLDGTATEIVRTSTGYTWMILLNKRNITNNNFYAALDNLGWQCLAATTTWPTHDLMLSPKINADSIVFSDISPQSVKLRWKNGNGAQRLVLAKEGSPINAFPLDGTDYTWDADFGDGSALGGNTFVVYSGTGNEVTVTGLTPKKKYYFRVIEYNKNSATGNYALYTLGDNAMDYTITENSFTFNGSGNWSNINNWSNGLIPPVNLPGGCSIMINPGGNGICVLDVKQQVRTTGSIQVAPGKKLEIQGDLIIGN